MTYAIRSLPAVALLAPSVLAVLISQTSQTTNLLTRVAPSFISVSSDRPCSAAFRRGGICFTTCTARRRLCANFVARLRRPSSDDDEDVVFGDGLTSAGDGTDPLMVFPLHQHSVVDKDIGKLSRIRFGTKTTEETEPSNVDLDVVPGSPPLSTFLSSAAAESADPARPDIAYFYLQDTLGLSEEEMWKITLEAGTVLGLTVRNLETKVSLLRRMMNLTDEDVRSIVAKHPTILHLSAQRNLGPTILSLVRALDLSKDELRSMVTQYPCVLCYSIENLMSKIDFFTSTMGFNKDESRELLLSEPKLLTAAVETGLRPRMKFLCEEVSIPIDTLRSIVQRNSNVLLYSLENNLREKIIFFFIMKLHMDTSQVQRLLSTYPAILNYNLDNHMLPIVRYFVSDLEFSPLEVRSILLKFPRLMTHSLFKIKHVVGYLRYELGMDATQVKRVLFQAPQAIGLSTENLLSKVVAIRDLFCLNDGELRAVLSGMPTLMLCSVEKNLKPKAEYLLYSFGGDKAELKESIITQPTLMGYSLEKRIKPRMEQICGIGAHPRSITVGITMTESNFLSWLEGKKAKIDRTGSDSRRRRKRVKEGQTIQAVVEPKDAKRKEDETKTESERRKARVVHWGR